MATNNILTFAETAALLDIYTDVEYLADTDQATGNKAGKAKRKLVNKTLKQTAKIAAGAAQFLADIQTTNITDALTTAQISTILQSSLLSNGIKRVRVASTVAISIAAPGATIDGVTMAAGDRFLEKDNATASARGIYVWNGAAVPATRALDSDNGAKFPTSTIVSVSEGAANLDTDWQLTTDGGVTIGVTALLFALAKTMVVTAAADSSFVDNSTRTPSTNWVRGAMTAIAAAAGFVLSPGQNGFIKFPSYLGSYLIQWVTGISDASSIMTVSWPTPFTTAVYGGVASELNSAGWATNSTTVWGFDATGSTLTTSVSRTRAITGVNGPAISSGISGRLLAWGR